MMERRQTEEWPCSLTSRIEMSGESAHLMNSHAAFLFLAFLGMPSPWLFDAGWSCTGPAGIRTTREVSFTLLSSESRIGVTQALEWMKMLERPVSSDCRALSSV